MQRWHVLPSLNDKPLLFTQQSHRPSDETASPAQFNCKKQSGGSVEFWEKMMDKGSVVINCIRTMHRLRGLPKYAMRYCSAEDRGTKLRYLPCAVAPPTKRSPTTATAARAVVRNISAKVAGTKMAVQQLRTAIPLQLFYCAP